MPRPSVTIVSRVAGLSAALSARGLAGSWIQHLEGPLDTAEAKAALASTEVLVGEPALCGPLVEQCPKLVWLQSTFAGCNQLLTASTRRDYTATRLAGCFGPDMAEYSMLHVLALERKYEAQREAQRQSHWHATRDEVGTAAGPGGKYRRLPSVTLGVLGLGDIGSEIARVASQGFRMRVVGCRRDPTPRESDAAAGVTRVFGLDSMPAFLAECDYLVSVLPSTPQTRGMLDGDVLAACASRSPAPALINVGRGDLLSESTILTALDQGWLSHYIGDVFVPEPLPVESKLWAHPKVTVTPHNSAVTQPSDVVAAFEENLERYEADGVGGLRNVFDWNSGY